MNPLPAAHDLLAELAGPASTKLALALLHFVWQGVLIATVAAVLMRWVGRRSAQRRYAIGVAGIGLMAIAPIATFCLVTPPVTEVDRLQTDAGAATLEEATDFVIYAERLDAFLLTLGSGTRESSGHSMELSRVPLPEDRLTWGERLRLIQPYAVLLWLAGSLLCGLRLVIGAYSSLRCRRGRRSVPDAWCDIVVKTATRIGIKRPSVFVSDRVAEAIVVGLLRPMVLLPAAWIGRIPPDVLEAVLAHELAHIGRYDLWVNLFQRVVESLLFYHPAVWWLSRRIRIEREYCCDETAAKAVAGRAAYARALEYVATERVAGGRTELFQAALAAGIRGEDSMALLNRVHRVLGNDHRPRRTPRLSEGLLALAVPAALWAAVVTIGPAFAQEEPVEAPHAEPTLDDVVEDIHRDFDVQPGKSLDDMVEGLAQNDDSRFQEPAVDWIPKDRDDDLHSVILDLRRELKSLRREVEELRTNQHVEDIGSKLPVYRDPSDAAKGDIPDDAARLLDSEPRTRQVDADQPYVLPDPGPTTQIRFTGPAGTTFNWLDFQGRTETTSIAPARRDLPHGASYSLRFMEIPGRKRLKLNARLQLPPAGPIAETFLSKNAVPIELTDEDLDQLASKNIVTKVVYLPKTDSPYHVPKQLETLVSTRLDPGVDPIAEAARRGPIVAVLNIVRHPLPLPDRKLIYGPDDPASDDEWERIPLDEDLSANAGDSLPTEVTDSDGRRYRAVTEAIETKDGKTIHFKRYVPVYETPSEGTLAPPDTSERALPVPKPFDGDEFTTINGVRYRARMEPHQTKDGKTIFIKRFGPVRPQHNDDAPTDDPFYRPGKPGASADNPFFRPKRPAEPKGPADEPAAELAGPTNKPSAARQTPDATGGLHSRADGASTKDAGGKPAVAPGGLTTVVRGDRIVTYRMGSDFDLLEVEIQQSGLPKSEEDVQSILEILTSLFGENRPVWAESSRWKKLDDDRVELEITLWNDSTPTFLLSEHNGRLRIKPVDRFFLSDGSAPFFDHDTPLKKPNSYGATGRSSIRQRSQVIETQDAVGIARQYRSGRNAMRVTTALEKPVSLHFEKTPLTHVIATLRNIADVDFVVDKAGLDEEGVTTETPVSIDVNDMPIRDVLSTILTPMNLAATTKDGLVVITSRQRSKGPLTVETYPVADLILPPNHGNIILNENGETAVALSDDVKRQATKRFDALVDLITVTVEPGSWEIVGGQGVIRKNETTLSLIIRQTNDVHDEIAKLLQRLGQLDHGDQRSDKINRKHFKPTDAADNSPSPAGKNTSVKVRVEQSGTYYVDGYAASATGLASAIKEAMADGDRTELVIQADRAAPFSAVARVIEAAKKIGVDEIRFATEPAASPNEDLSGETSDNEAMQDGKTATEWDKLVFEYNELIKQRNFTEALTIAKKIRELDPENQSAVTMYYKAKVLLEKTRQPSPDRHTSTEALLDSTLEIEPVRKDSIRELQKQIENLQKQLEKQQSADNAADASDKKPNDGDREKDKKDKGEANEPRTEIDMLRVIVRGLTGNLEELPQKPPVPLTGEVLATAKAPGSGNEFVEISLGNDDGLRKGATLSVIRDDDFLGKLTITNVRSDRSVGHLTTRARDAEIRKGDVVKPSF